MQKFDLCLLLVLALAVSLGAWSIWWVRGGHGQALSTWGSRLFIACLLIIGAGNVVALTCAASYLLPYGLSAGWLVIAMLWENPFKSW